MRKIIVSEMVSLDGFFAGSDGNINWHMVNDEFNKYAIDFLKTVDTILFGRVTYQMFENYWPAAITNPETSKDDLVIAHLIDDANKIVFSRTMDKTGWKNTKLMKEVDAEEIRKMKEQPGKDMVVYGSGMVVSELARLGLVDEYRLFVAPIVLGSGKLLLKDLKKEMKLKFIESKPLSNGVVLLCYTPA